MNIESAQPEIRYIEDIIDMQKANGSFQLRQVAFDVPMKTDSNISTNIVKSLEFGSKFRMSTKKKKHKMQKYKRNKDRASDVVSWPSDSDITVLRMKLRLTNTLKDGLENAIPGDGLHQPDSSSMINLATLMLQSRSPSKHSLNVEEYLLPISSWGRETMKFSEKDTEEMKKQINLGLSYIDSNLNACQLMLSNHSAREDVFLCDNDSAYDTNVKSKVARFLRLYFCPCCTCLYKLENKS